MDKPKYAIDDVIYCVNPKGETTAAAVSGSRIDSYGEKGYEKVIYTLCYKGEPTFELPETKVFHSLNLLVASLKKNCKK